LEESEQLSKAESVLDCYDWPIVTPTFELALACIRRQYDNIIPLAKAAADFGLSYNEVKTYVVFREARKQKEFMDCFPRTLLGIEHYANPWACPWLGEPRPTGIEMSCGAGPNPS